MHWFHLYEERLNQGTLKSRLRAGYRKDIHWEFFQFSVLLARIGCTLAILAGFRENLLLGVGVLVISTTLLVIVELKYAVHLRVKSLAELELNEHLSKLESQLTNYKLDYQTKQGILDKASSYAKYGETSRNTPREQYYIDSAGTRFTVHFSPQAPYGSLNA